MKKKRYFLLHMWSMVIIYILSTGVFFYLYHPPIANPLDEEVMWDSIDGDGNMLHKYILFSYQTSFQDNPNIAGFKVETNSEHHFNFAVEEGWVDEKYNAYPDTRHIAKFIIEYSESSPLREPVEITKLTINFASGYEVEVPIEKLILTPYHKEESEEVSG